MTRPFAALERFLERLLERPAARLFRAPLQPVQLQRRLERTMDSGRVFSADRTYVPNHYRVALHTADFVVFEAYQGTLERELADALHQRARARGYRLLARPEVQLVGSERVDPGDIRVTADLLDSSALEGGAAAVPIQPARPTDSRPTPGPPNLPAITDSAPEGGAADGGPVPVRPPSPFAAPMLQATAPAAAGIPAPIAGAASGDPVSPLEPGQLPHLGPTSAPPVTAAAASAAPDFTTPPGSASITAVYATPRVNPPLAIVEIRTLAGPATEFTFSGGSARVGRAWENEIVLPDDRVSRRHGQLTTRHGALVYTDLGSTNGSFLNGTRISEIALGSDDVLRLGNSTLTIKRHH